MEKIFEYREYIENEILNESDFLFENIENMDDYVNEVFSSEFFDYQSILESTRDYYEEEIYREYRKIRPTLVKGKQPKNLTENYFRLEKENLKRKLEADRSYLKRSVSRLIEKLNRINEEDFDIEKQLERKEKIWNLQSYQRKMVRQINNEITYVDKFYASNPKILVI